MGFIRIALVAIGSALIAIGLTVWTGWIFQVMPLSTFGAAGTPMGANAAGCTVAAGIGLLAIVRGRVKWARVMAGVIAAVVGLTLLQAFSGLDWGIDRWLGLQLKAGTIRPPPMPSFAAGAFFLVSVALTLLPDKKSWLGFGAGIGGGLLFVALLGLFSLLITENFEQALSASRAIGLPTALALALFALGLLTWIGAHRGELGVTCCLVAAAMAVVMAVGATTRQSLSEFRTSNTRVARTLETEVAIEQLAGSLARLDASARSFAITGGPRFLSQSESQMAEVRRQLIVLASVLKEHPKQLERLRELGPLVDENIRENEALMRGGAAPERKGAAREADSAAIESSLALSALIRDLRADERGRRTQAFEGIARTEAHTKTLQAMAGTAAAFLVGLAFWLAWRAVLIRQVAEGALIGARDQALEHSRLKSEFLANMSHEIRTPMNGVIGMTSLLAETPISPEQREYVETIRVCGESLLILINDILDFSKIESGRVELEEQEFDIVTCIDETLVLFKAKAREKAIDLSYTVDPSVPRVVVGDVTRVRQVVANLVSNAIKFTPAGEIEVSMRRLGSATDASCLLAIKVRDTGIGIPEKKRHRLFQPFTQVEASTNRRFGGTGLGLSISRRLSELMGGSLEVESVEGQGSTFQFTIRVGVVATRHSISSGAGEAWNPGRLGSGPATVSALTSRDDLPSFKILLAEDNATNQLVAQRMLAKLGYRVDTVANGQEVLEALSRQRYDIILMDVQMPIIDGVEATVRVRRDPTLKSLWIIAMTANAMTGDRERCLAAGMNDYVSKPVTLEELRHALSRAAFNLADKTRISEVRDQ
jgi:signal transduction histidine kinase/ActR/RegA family two-component response regulator